MPEPHTSHCGGLQNAGVMVPLDIMNPRLPVIPAHIYPPQELSVTLQIPSGLLYPLITERALGLSGHPRVPRSDELPRELYLLVSLLLFLTKKEHSFFETKAWINFFRPSSEAHSFLENYPFLLC